MAFQDREKHEHPSFGMLTINRTSGHSGFLFGSNAEPNNYISMELRQGYMERELSKDWYGSDKVLFRVKMSPVQFAELLTTQNGTGVPVTIERMNGERVEQVKYTEDKRHAHERQFREKLEKFSERMLANREEAKKLIAKKTLSKNDQQELNRFMDAIVQEVTGSIPFYITCFDEEIDRVVVDAKAEINAAITHTIVQAGVKALGFEFNSEGQLEVKEKTDGKPEDNM